jgi:hypothetical protein
LGNFLISITVLAHIIAGEAGICNLDAKLAVAHVVANREAVGITGGWYGWSEPSEADIAVASMYTKTVDMTRGATFLLSMEDVQHSGVQSMLVGYERTAVFVCAGGLALEAWRKKQ